MTTDDFGSVVYPGSIDNGAIDTEHSPILYPPKSDRICAADERFASVNEAIGLLDYKLEQHITQCADGLAPLADFISASWAVIDELVTRIEQLEAAQPIPTIARAATIDNDALTAAYMVGRADERAIARAELDELRSDVETMNELQECLMTVGSHCEIIAEQWVQCEICSSAGTYNGTGNTIVEAIKDALKRTQE